MAYTGSATRGTSGAWTPAIVDYVGTTIVDNTLDGAQQKEREVLVVNTKDGELSLILIAPSQTLKLEADPEGCRTILKADLTNANPRNVVKFKAPGGVKLDSDDVVSLAYAAAKEATRSDPTNPNSPPITFDVGGLKGASIGFLWINQDSSFAVFAVDKSKDGNSRKAKV